MVIFVPASSWQLCLSPFGEYLCPKSTLTEDVAFCRLLSAKTVEEHLHFNT
jgi:hypothetical protein